MASLLKRFLDADEWLAEDVIGRLGMIFHAAFLFAGFQPYGAKPRSGYLLKHSSKTGNSLCLSRCYTAQELTYREGGADAAVLMLCAQGRDIGILLFLKESGDMENHPYLERLDWLMNLYLSFALSRSLDDVEPWGSQVCKLLADGLCWRLHHELCRRNGLPLTSFMSLPDDLKVLILSKLTDGKDLARVECVSAELRRLVANHDGELWKHMFDVMPVRRPMRLRDSWLYSFGACLAAVFLAGIPSIYPGRSPRAKSPQVSSLPPLAACYAGESGPCEPFFPVEYHPTYRHRAALPVSLRSPRPLARAEKPPPPPSSSPPLLPIPARPTPRMQVQVRLLQPSSPSPDSATTSASASSDFDLSPHLPGSQASGVQAQIKQGRQES